MRYNEVVEYLQNLTNGEFSQSEIGRIIGKTRATINSRKINNSSFAPEEVAQLKNYYEKKISYTRSLTNSIQNPIQKIDIDNDNIMLDYFPEVFGSCGNGVFELNQEKEIIAVPKKCFFTNVSKVKQYSVINAKGNSMQPFLYEGDKLIVEHYDGSQILDNKPYVFCYKDEIFVKRLAKNINQLMIVSENPVYDTIKLSGDELKDVTIIGQIVGLMRDLR